MKPIVEALGVDYTQWRALTRAYFFVDHAALFGTYGYAASVRAARNLMVMVLLFGLIGGSPAVFVLVCRDVLLSATVMTTTVGVMVATMVLGQGSMIASPDDYAIVGFRPVSSRTYFAVRLTGVLGNAVGIAVVCGYLPVGAFLLGERGSAALAAAAAAAVLATALATTFLLMGLYGWLVQVVRPSLVERIVGWVPIVSALAVVAVFGAAMFQFMDAALPSMDLMEGMSLARAELPRTTWLLAYPPVWFASYVEIAQGGADGFARSAAIMSVVSLAGAVVLLRGRLSTAFASRLAQIASASTSAVRRTRLTPPWPWLRGEHRALALVMRAQLGSDAAFQTHATISVLAVVGVLGSMPLFWMPTDPFHGSSPEFLVVIAVGFLAFSFYGGLASSQASDATWPFFTTPTARGRLILAARDITAVVILVPAAAGLLGILLYGFDHAGHAIVHAAVIALLAFIELQVAVLVMPAVPFSVPIGVRSGFGVRQFLISFVPLTIYFALHLLAYRSWQGTAIGLVALVVVIAGLEGVLRRRLGG